MVFLAAGFLVVALATGFLAAALAAGFLAAVLVAALAAAGFLAVDFLAPRVTPAALASFAAAALRREAVFFLIRSFLAALSYSDWSLDRFSAEGLARNAFNAVLIDFLISLLCSVRFSAWRAAFLADLIIGMYIPIG